MNGVNGAEVPGSAPADGWKAVGSGRNRKKKNKSKNKKQQLIETPPNGTIASSEADTDSMIDKTTASEPLPPASATNGAFNPNDDACSEAWNGNGHATEGAGSSETSAVPQQDSEWEYDEASIQRANVEGWFDSKTTQPYRNLGALLKEHVLDHLVHLKYSDANDVDWKLAIRHMIWRAVIRSNYFWVNPDTGSGGKATPIRVPDGVYEANFEIFVMCCAEKADRVGRDLPSPEHVQSVEAEVRKLLFLAEKRGMHRHLAHFAFLLLVDEDRRNVLTAADMQERIRRVFPGATMDWTGYQIFKKGVEPTKPPVHGSSLTVSDAIWHDAVAELAT